MRLNKNMFSLRIYDNYSRNLESSSTAMSRINSGLKINSAKDNPNRIARSELLKIQITSTDAARKNVQDTNSMLQTFDSAMQEINNNLSRIKELTVKAGSTELTPDDRNSIQTEINSVANNIDYLAKNTDFNGVKLLDGKGEQKISATIGIMDNETTQIPRYDLTLEGFGIENFSIKDGNIDEALTNIDKAIKIVAIGRSKYGALQNSLEDTQTNLEQNDISLQGAQSNIADSDIAEEMLKYSQSQILVQSSIALMAQSNQIPQDALQTLANVK